MYRRIITFILLILSLCLTSLNIKSISKDDNYIDVEIKGEVENPGIYKMKQDANLNDLLNVAVTNKNANTDNISLLDKLYNNEVVVIEEKSDDALISINSGDIDDLIKLPGIGEKTAKKIIKYRNINGSFNSLNELMNISGIGLKKYEKLKDYISL